MDNVGIYHTEKLTFYIYPKKVIVCTALQCFKVVKVKPYTARELVNFKKKIKAGKVQCLDDVAGLTRNLGWEYNVKI